MKSHNDKLKRRPLKKKNMSALLKNLSNNVRSSIEHIKSNRNSARISDILGDDLLKELDTLLKSDDEQLKEASDFIDKESERLNKVEEEINKIEEPIIINKGVENFEIEQEKKFKKLLDEQIKNDKLCYLYAVIVEVKNSFDFIDQLLLWKIPFNKYQIDNILVNRIWNKCTSGGNLLDKKKSIFLNIFEVSETLINPPTDTSQMEIDELFSNIFIDYWGSMNKDERNEIIKDIAKEKDLVKYANIPIMESVNIILNQLANTKISTYIYNLQKPKDYVLSIEYLYEEYKKRQIKGKDIAFKELGFNPKILHDKLQILLPKTDIDELICISKDNNNRYYLSNSELENFFKDVGYSEGTIKNLINNFRPSNSNFGRRKHKYRKSLKKKRYRRSKIKIRKKKKSKKSKNRRRSRRRSIKK